MAASVEEELRKARAKMARAAGEKPETPVELVPKQRAAAELRVSPRKLSLLIRAGWVVTWHLDKRRSQRSQRIPASEVARLAKSRR
jgi:hypothetical protein